MMKALIRRYTPAVVILVAVVHGIAADLYIDANGDQEHPGTELEGEYAGQLLVEQGAEEMNVGLVVTSKSNNEYEAILYYGGLPDEQSGPVADDDKVELEGTYEDFTLKLVGDIPLRFQYINGRFTALDEQNNYMGHLDRVVRVRPNS